MLRNRKSFRSGRVKAYFTVEAALVMPLVIGVQLFVIYFMFFQYDRCLMEQDAASLVLKGVSAQETDKEKLMGTLQQKEKEQNKKKYVTWEREEVKISLKGYKISVRLSGHLKLDIQRSWKAKASYEGTRISPVFFVRSCRKVLKE